MSSSEVITTIVAEYEALLKETPPPSPVRLDDLLQSAKMRLPEVWSSIVEHCRVLSTRPGGRKEGEAECMFHLRLVQFAEMVFIPCLSVGGFRKGPVETEEELTKAVLKSIHSLWDDWYERKMEEAEAECDSPGWIGWKTFDEDIVVAWWENDATSERDWEDSYCSEFLANYNAVHKTDLKPVFGDPVPTCEAMKKVCGWIASLRTHVADADILAGDLEKADIDDGWMCEFFKDLTTGVKSGHSVAKAVEVWKELDDVIPAASE